jgi:cell division septum initiation protein DivIVA
MVLGSSVIAAIVSWFINRKKTEAEIKQITVSSEIELSGATLNYAKEVKAMYDDLRRDYNEIKQENARLEMQVEELQNKYNRLVSFLVKLGYKESEVLG